MDKAHRVRTCNHKYQRTMIELVDLPSFQEERNHNTSKHERDTLSISIVLPLFCHTMKVIWCQEALFCHTMNFDHISAIIMYSVKHIYSIYLSIL